MEIKIANDDDWGIWDEFIINNPDASPYLLFGWKKALEEAYGHQTYYLFALENKKIVGVLPLALIRIPFFGSNLVSLPFCDYGGVVSGEERVRELLLEEAVRLGGELKVNKVEIRSIFKYHQLESSKYPVNVITDKVRMMLPLSEDSQKTWGGFKSKLRSQIRKAEKNNLTFIWGEKRDIEEFYRVWSINMRDLGSPAHAKKWFHNIINGYGDSAKIALVKNDYGETVASAIILLTDHVVCIPWASTIRKYNKLSPNMLLYWNILKYCSDHGYNLFDFGRCSPQGGTYKFKEQWGAARQELFWHEISLKNGRYDNSSGINSRKREFVERIWSRLPVAFTNIAGPLIRKYISL
ncbi:MAG: FemAB family PEP-CTERM system-associated protein [Candidatus Thiodiazotropha sp. (ex Dulcina madagascariensis)]|nr:FemAB family PEP-CTERM system-associated protein [Candidatus Thiodiazotropha sp. (ex Dulcina madagascariensis)]